METLSFLNTVCEPLTCAFFWSFGRVVVWTVLQIVATVLMSFESNVSLPAVCTARLMWEILDILTQARDRIQKGKSTKDHGSLFLRLRLCLGPLVDHCTLTLPSPPTSTLPPLPMTTCASFRSSTSSARRVQTANVKKNDRSPCCACAMQGHDTFRTPNNSVCFFVGLRR